MRSYRRVVLLLAAVVIAGATVLAGLRGRGAVRRPFELHLEAHQAAGRAIGDPQSSESRRPQKPAPVTSDQRIKDADQLNVPVTDLRSQQQLANDPLRRIRGRRHGLKDKTIQGETLKKFILKEDDPEVGFAGVSEHDPPERALPVNDSDVIAIGEVTDARAYLSEDQVSIYSEFAFRVEEVLKRGDEAPALSAGDTLTTMRPGGGVRFPSGKVIKRGTAGRTMPVMGRRYLLFLKYDREGQDFYIVTGYELREGKVRPLDGIPSFGTPDHPFVAYSAYQGADESSLLNDVRAAIAAPPQKGGRYWDGARWREPR